MSEIETSVYLKSWISVNRLSNNWAQKFGILPSVLETAGVSAGFTHQASKLFRVTKIIKIIFHVSKLLHLKEEREKTISQPSHHN